MLRILILCTSLLLARAALGQTTDEPPAPPPGQVLREAPTEPMVPTDTRPLVPVGDDERSAVEITALALDLHLIPAQAREEAHATITLRNRSAAAITRIPLQLSSTLHWLSAKSATPAGLQALPYTQSPVATDTDHTGYAQEAVFTPAEPLAPGATLVLAVVYSGEIRQNADRLELLGAPHDKASVTDWDAIADTSDAGSTALRGFGDVLWYPVAEPTAQLGNGNQLFDLIARARRHNSDVAMRLRLTVEYVGDPPDAAIFDGQLQPLAKLPDTTDSTVAETHGTATAEWPLAPIGLRSPSLFLTAQHAVSTPDQLLTVITPNLDAVEPYAAAVSALQPVVSGLLGPTPRAPLLLLDHPGQPFEDAGFLAAPLVADADPKLAAPALVRGLTHAWLSSPERTVPVVSQWVAEGLAELVSLVWTETSQGREAAIGELRHASLLIALAEDANHPQPLITASSDAMLRLKSGFVFWQLREMLGDAAFSKALTAWRHSLALNPTLDRDPKAFELSLERSTGSDLAWFFADWVYADPGLPDLTIVAANPRAMPAKGGKSAGFLVAVDVRNDGDAVADVPVTVRSGSLSATERLRIPAHSSGSTRVVFEGAPEIVEVNDGSVPELRTTTHTLSFAPEAKP